MKLQLITFTLSIIPFFSKSQVGQFNTLSTKQMNVYDAISADLDNDGDQDVIATSSDDGTLAWYKNLGNGAFSKQIPIAYGGTSLKSLRVGDLDNDGDLDVVVAQSSPAMIRVFQNQGNGVIVGASNLAGGIGGIFAVELADMDSDGDLDIVTNTTSDLRWIENLGGLSFNAPQFVVGGMSDVRQIRAVDLEGDNDIDLVVADYANNDIYAIINQGGGSYLYTVVSALANGASDVFISDIDGDLDPDIISASQQDGKIAWYANQGSATFGAQQLIYTFPGNFGAWRISVGDVDVDGDDDIVFNMSNSVYAIENTGSVSFSAPVAVSPNAYNVSTVSVGNIDGINGLEIIFGTSGTINENLVGWMQNQGGLNFGFPDILTSHAPDAKAVRFFDVDGDGVKDVLYGYQRGFRWHRNLGNGEFARHQYLTIPSNFLDVTDFEIGDMDNDSDLDIVYMAGTLGTGTISWFENQGNGVFVEDTLTTWLQGGNTIDLADLDGDNDLDVLYCYGWTGMNAVGWMENLGGGNFGSQQALGPEAIDVRADDLDNDGDQDVIASLMSATQLVWYENLGGSTFSAAQVIHDSTDTPMYINLLDIDNDNDNDLIVFYDNTYSICYFENYGNGTFGNRQYLETISSQTAISLIDIDDDGDLDLIYGQGYTTSTDQLLWRENLGNGTFAPQLALYSNWQGNRPSALAGGDVDDDGDMDIIMGSWFDDVVGWHENYFYYNTQISGRLFVDQNQNLVYDSSDFYLPQLGVFSTPQSDFAFTYADGKYFMNFSDTAGTYTIEPQQLQYWSVITSPSDTTITLNSTNPVIDSLDFGYYPDTIITVLNPELVGAFPSCNTVVDYWLSVQNIGTTIPSGVIHLQLHDSLTFVASNVAADSIQGNNYYWSYDSLYYFTDTLINIQVLMPDFNSMGDTLSSILEVLADSSGTLLFNNADTLDQILVCAYDPNDKIADPSGIDSLGYVPLSTSEFEYTIRFQNTGTDTAQNVVIKDMLDPNLVWNSLTYLASSHDVTISGDQYGEVTFNFANIMLPDSNVNEIASHGFVKYRIDVVPGTPNNTSIYNTADIFFDQNPAVVTNTKINTLFDCDTMVNSVQTNSVYCEGDSVNLLVQDTFSSTAYSWFLDTVELSAVNELNWLPDTTGLITLYLLAENEFCSAGQYKDVNIFQAAVTNLPDITICNGDSIWIFNSYQDQAGTYFDSLQTVNGCDSVVISNLFILATDSITYPDVEICSGDSAYIFGQYQFTSGLYTSIYQNVLGCDSSEYINLVVRPEVILTLGDVQEDTLCSVNSPVPVPGALPTGGTYYGPGVNGYQFYPGNADLGQNTIYYQYDDAYGCSWIDSVYISVLDCASLPELANLELSVYPNPFKDVVQIELNGSGGQNYFYEVLDLSGRIILTEREFENGVAIIYGDELGTGTFILNILNEDGIPSLRTKLVVVK